ncbi:unnamed protein product [Calypogeia fissa]
MTKSEEELVKCVELPGRGRGLVTTRHINGGEVILRESPAFLYVSHCFALTYCGTCLRRCSPPTNSCSECRAVTFCSSACSQRHSPHLCSALAELNKTGIVDHGDTADQARFLLSAYLLALSLPSEFERLMLLEGVGVVDDAVRELHAFVEEAVRGWPWRSVGEEKKWEVSVEVTADLLAKDARNTFGYMAPFEVGGERTVRGHGVYQTASFINHDCLPNSCRFDYLDGPIDCNTDIYIRALYSIPENTEVTISYFPINWPFKSRVERLSEEYGFVCKCKRCQLEEGWTDSDSEGEEDNEDEVISSETARPDKTYENGMSTSGIENEEEEEEDGEGEGEERKGKGMAEVQEDIGDDELEHALFFLKYLCPIEGCGGTMAPLASPPAASLNSTMECNMCGHKRRGDELEREVAGG